MASYRFWATLPLLRAMQTRDRMTPGRARMHPGTVCRVGFLDRAKKLAEQAKEMAEAAGGSTTTLPDGRWLVFLGDEEQRVVLEVAGIDPGVRANLARTVAAQLHTN